MDISPFQAILNDTDEHRRIVGGKRTKKAALERAAELGQIVGGGLGTVVIWNQIEDVFCDRDERIVIGVGRSLSFLGCDVIDVV